MTQKKEPQLYIVKRPIRYHHPEHPLGGKIVLPEDKAGQEGLPMDHLDEPTLSLLVRKKVLVAKPAK